MESNKEEKIKTVSEENIYKLNGRVPLKKAIPFGLQHVLAMFVSNLAPVLIVCSAAVLRSNGAHLSSAEITQLLQCAMFVAGIGTCLQLYPIGVIGSGLPIIMGVSFTFLGSLLVIATNPDLGYEAMAGAVILGGIFEGFVGLSAKYWRKYLTPVVSACVVIAIGLSLLPVGMDSWGGGSGVKDFGSWYHLVVGAFTLIVCLVSREPAYIHMEWNSKELENKDQMLKNIEEYLNKMHGEVYSYRIYSPEIDLKNNGYKVKQSIRVIMQAGILFLIAFLGGMISIFELLFNHRKKAYGISLACGADYRTVFYEMFAEVALLNGIGMFIGIGIGYIVTYFVDMGIMIGYIKVEGSIVSFIASISVYLLITIIVSGKSYIKIKQRKVIELLNGD